MEKLNTVDIPNDYDEFVDLLNPILIPRPPDSSGNVQVRNVSQKYVLCHNNNK